MIRPINQDKIKDVALNIVRQFHPEKIILFGSWAWGSPGPDSDVDLLIIKETDDTRRMAREIDMSLFPRPFPIDLIVCKPSQAEKRMHMGDFFFHDIFDKGTVLYSK